MAASFQRTVCEILTDHLLAAYKQYQPQSVVIAGGVAANQRLRKEIADKLPAQLHYAPIDLCTDNGAMVAALGYQLARANQVTDPRQLVADPGLSIPH